MTKRPSDGSSSSPQFRGPKTQKVDPQKSQQHNLLNNTTSSQSNPVSLPMKAAKPKPIFVDAHISQVKKALNNLTFEKQPSLTYRCVGVDKIPKSRIYPLTLKDKELVMKSLSKANLEHWSYSDEKLPTFALKFFYKESPDEMMKLLQKHKVPVKTVSVIVDSACPIYAIKFSDNNINLTKLTTTFAKIEDINIKWEALRQSKKRLTQCYNCQRWGHSSANCGFKFRCVACGSSEHQPGNCPRKSVIDTEMVEDNNSSIPKEKPKCCNCGEDHAANFRQCKAFKEYAGDIKKTRSRNEARRNQQVPTFNMNHNYEQNFPSVRSSLSSSHAGGVSKSAFDRENLKNIVNPPKTTQYEASKSNFSRHSFRDVFKNGESQNHSQQNNQCNNCSLMTELIKQLQQQIYFLTNQVCQLMSKFQSNQQQCFP